ncbi:MAG: purine-binding chemotaxis protein CheW [Tissierellia bacterium]|nr:purine-binding chemotaxis protein CheW [Tissierellia bacterium]
MSRKQYVVFKLGKEEFGIDIMNVKEIIPYQESIHVPDTPGFIEGIINYRDSVIPIISLKERFKLDEKGSTKDTRIIVITLKDKDVGFIVDEVSQTLYLDDDEVDPTPEIIIGVDRKYITGVGKLGGDRLLILIDLEAILTEEEKDEIEMLEDEIEELEP